MMESPETRVLLLEDNDAHAEMVSLALEKLAYPPEVHRFSRSEEMIRWVERYDAGGDGDAPRPCFALIDLRLPGASGLDALARLRQSPTIGDMPVAILTSSLEADDRQVAEGIGVQAYMVKPVGLDQIVPFATGHAV